MRKELSEKFNKEIVIIKRDIETIKKKQSKMKNKIIKMKNTLKGINIRIDEAEDGITNLEDKEVREGFPEEVMFELRSNGCIRIYL